MSNLDLKPKEDEVTEDEMKLLLLFEKVRDKVLSPFQALMEMEKLVEGSPNEDIKPSGEIHG